MTDREKQAFKAEAFNAIQAILEGYPLDEGIGMLEIVKNNLITDSMDEYDEMVDDIEIDGLHGDN